MNPLRSFCATVTLALASLAAAGPQLTIGGGRIEGVREGEVSTYKGVPFAAPPLDVLRWREPQPVPSWQGVRQATAFAPACAQTGVSMPGEVLGPTSEDCLYLNVWTPAHSASERLPVLVWIYGGGFVNGSASMPLYWGDRLARRGVVVVTVAYRVGAFGFLAHPELTRESPNATSGNYGLMDQVAALRWVQHNIAAFGGDPGQVTIAGQSAGSMSVSILMASREARGLFHRAIGQSGGFFEPVQLAPHYLLANAERDGVAFSRALGASSLAELRALSTEAVLKGNAARIAHPVVELHLLQRPPYDSFAAGQQAPVPLLLGVNAQESTALSDTRQVKAASFAADITKTFGPLPPPLLQPYPFDGDDEARRARIAFETDLRFGWNMWTWARLHAAQGAPVYAYRFEHSPPFPADSPHAGWGASHFAELWYMFDHLDQTPWPWTEADRRLSDQMARYWTQFIKTGNPNASGLPEWPAQGVGADSLLVLREPPARGRADRPDALKVFDAVFSQLRGLPLR